MESLFTTRMRLRMNLLSTMYVTKNTMETWSISSYMRDSLEMWVLRTNLVKYRIIDGRVFW